MSDLMDDLMLNDRDVEHPTVEIPALDTWVVEDGDDMPADHHRSYPADCFCPDRRHRDLRDHEEVEFPSSYVRVGAHRITVHLYAVITEENDPRMARDSNRDLRGDEINRIRPDLDKRSPEKVKADKTKAGRAAAADSAIRSGGDEKDRTGLFGMIFGRKS